ncbi:MAG: hypothetical protein ACUVV0_05760 [Anaerolineae bacterium]
MNRKKLLVLLAMLLIAILLACVPSKEERAKGVRKVTIQDFVIQRYPKGVIIAQYVVKGWDTSLFGPDGKPIGLHIGDLIPSEDGKPVEAYIPLSNRPSTPETVLVWRPFFWAEEKGWWPAFPQPPYGLVAYYSHEDKGDYQLWLENPLLQSFHPWEETFKTEEEERAVREEKPLYGRLAY